MKKYIFKIIPIIFPNKSRLFRYNAGISPDNYRIGVKLRIEENTIEALSNKGLLIEEA